jgi:hypothetical protein
VTRRRQQRPVRAVAFAAKEAGIPAKRESAKARKLSTKSAALYVQEGGGDDKALKNNKLLVLCDVSGQAFP